MRISALSLATTWPTDALDVLSRRAVDDRPATHNGNQQPARHAQRRDAHRDQPRPRRSLHAQHRSEQTPWPAHPNTLSFVESVFKDEITEADNAGKLTQGMIRAPRAAERAKIDAMPSPMLTRVRDQISSQYFNGEITTKGRMTDASIGGVTLNRDSLALLLGAPDGAQVFVKQAKSRIEVEATHPLYTFPQQAFITSDGVLHWESLFLRDDAPAGIGTRIAATMVEAAQAAGLKEIQMNAWGPPNYNGHYTWPRLGWDGEFAADEVRKLAKAGFGGATTVRALMQTEVGREWWKTNGWSMELKFDLDVEGKSVRTLNSYLAGKGVWL